MKAAVLFGNGDIRYEDHPEPDLGPGMVKIRVRAAGICGSDIPRALHGGAHFYPVVLGHEFAGDVAAIGPEGDAAGSEGATHALAVGDTVSGVPLIPCMVCADCQRGDFSLCRRYRFIGSREDGAFADYVVVPAQNAVRYDPSIPYTHAALFEPSAVAIHAIRHSGFRGGGRVAILGGGTIGLFAMQWAKIFGARQVTVFDIDDGRLALAKRLGADDTVNTRKDGLMDDADGAAVAAGRFDFDSVFETAGSPATMRMAFELAANHANVCFVGTPHENLVFAPGQWEWMNRKELRATGSWMSYSAPFPGVEWEWTAHYFATGQLKFDSELIFRTFPMAAAGEAFSLFRDPSQVHGRVMLLNDP
jgi:L-iditol 2-dehydrogenase